MLLVMSVHAHQRTHIRCCTTGCPAVTRSLRRMTDDADAPSVARLWARVNKGCS